MADEIGGRRGSDSFCRSLCDQIGFRFDKPIRIGAFPFPTFPFGHSGSRFRLSRHPSLQSNPIFCQQPTHGPNHLGATSFPALAWAFVYGDAFRNFPLTRKQASVLVAESFIRKHIKNTRLIFHATYQACAECSEVCPYMAKKALQMLIWPRKKKMQIYVLFLKPCLMY